eukprot:1323491-Amorphochlora_amoeboformis.AAC.1
MPKPVFVQERDEESVSLLQDSPKLPAEETSVKIGVSERGSNNQGQNAVQKSMSMKMVAFFGLNKNGGETWLPKGLSLSVYLPKSVISGRTCIVLQAVADRRKM